MTWVGRRDDDVAAPASLAPNLKSHFLGMLDAKEGSTSPGIPYFTSLSWRIYHLKIALLSSSSLSAMAKSQALQSNMDVDYVISYRFAKTGSYCRGGYLGQAVGTDHDTDKAKAIAQLEKLCQAVSNVGLQTEVRLGDSDTVLLFVRVVSDQHLFGEVYRSRYTSTHTFPHYQLTHNVTEYVTGSTAYAQLLLPRSRASRSTPNPCTRPNDYASYISSSQTLHQRVVLVSRQKKASGRMSLRSSPCMTMPTTKTGSRSGLRSTSSRRKIWMTSATVSARR